MGRGRARAEALAVPGVPFLLALAVRIWWVRHWILPPYGDQPSLERYAARVAHGLFYGTHGAYWPPAFIFFAGGLERLFGTGHAELAVRSADAVLGALCAAVTADLARRLFHHAWAGLAAGLLWALYVPAVYYTDAFLGVTLGTLLLVACCDAAVAYGERPGAARLAAAGVLLGLGTLCKPTELPLIVPMFLQWGLRAERGFAWRFALASAGVALGIALLLNVPWTVRNLAVTGAPVFVDMNGGVNFYIAHNPAATGMFVALGPDNPVLLSGCGYDCPGTGTVALRAGASYFLAHPGADARQAARILRWFWTERDPDIPHFGGLLVRLAALLHDPVPGFGGLRDLALLGAAAWLPRWRRVVLLPLTALGQSAGLALLFFAPRFRLPVEPLLAVSAGWGAVCIASAVARAWRAGRPRSAAGGGTPLPSGRAARRVEVAAAHAGGDGLHAVRGVELAEEVL